MRTFIAIDVPSEIREELAGLSRELGNLGLDGRKTGAGSIHITLKFLGEIAPDRVGAIQEVMLACRSGTTAFELELGGLGVFPRIERPRVVWVGLKRSPELTQLQKQLELGLSEIGFPREDRPFQPHLTLMRLKSQKGVARLTQFLATRESPDRPNRYGVAEFHLYQSILKPQGAEYRKLLSVPLDL